jgi:hypothetical protein
MNNRYVIFEEKEVIQIISDIKEIKEIIKEKHKPYPLPDHWLTSDETCEILSISKRQLQKYRDNRQIKFSKIEAKIYFKATDIQKFLESNYNGR